MRIMCNFTKWAKPCSGVREQVSASLQFKRVLPLPYALLGNRIYQPALVSFLTFPMESVAEGHFLSVWRVGEGNQLEMHESLNEKTK